MPAKFGLFHVEMAIKSPIEPISLNQHLVYICSRLLAYGVPLFYFLVAISFYLKTYDSAQVKITFTQIGGTMLICTWLTKILLEGRWPFSKRDVVYVAPFLAFLASGLIAYAHSPFKGWAFEETFRRVIYAGIAMITLAEFRSDERMARLWRWLIWAAVISVGYGVIQYIDSRYFPSPGKGIDPFIWRQAFGPRIFSTFGNPNFYGNFLVIITPLIMATILKEKGPLSRMFTMIGITLLAIFLIDKMQLNLFGGFDPSYRVVFGALILLVLIGFVGAATYNVGNSTRVSLFLILFAFLFLNLYSTETKGAWLGFVAALSATLFLILEYFLKLEEIEIQAKKYLGFLAAITILLLGVVSLLSITFILPLFSDGRHQTGFNILWIPAVGAIAVAVISLLWIYRKPWNLKKILYGFIIFFVLGMGGLVLKYAESRLTSVSFRVFTWISTWEMIKTNPILGSGVGSFKAVYPAFRRPQIIVLEGKSNTETDHAEDEYIEVWQDEGIIGFGLFLWLVIFSISCGLKQLRWFSNIRAPNLVKRRKILEVQNDPRSYEVLGILGAFIGALIHWGVDVSIRFVSSGVFSLFLPALLVTYSRNHDNPIREEVRLGYDRSIRFGLACFWTFVMIFLQMELVPQSFIPTGDTSQLKIVFFALLSGGFLYALLEFVESGDINKKQISIEEQYPRPSNRLIPLRYAAIFLVLLTGSFGILKFRNFFFADVHHNLAIFFSKQSIWSNGPEFRGEIAKLPPDIKKKYMKYGGALEQYEEVIRLNPFFPMAKYFTGNVHNDRGTQLIQRATQARQRGDFDEAERLRKKALETWDLAEQAYMNTKELAPNYVQTHHQMGLLNVKRAEQAMIWGDASGADKFYDEAFKHFNLYHMIDPVFPPNHHRLVQILLRDEKYEEAQELYKEAIFYSDQVSWDIRKYKDVGTLSDLQVSLARLYFTQATKRTANPFNPVQPEVAMALKYFDEATQVNPKSTDAWKGKGFLLEKMGRLPEAQAAFQEALKLNPNDPEIRPNVSGT